MPIKNTTRQALENFIDQYPGVNLVDATENNDSGEWILSCDACGEEFTTRVYSLKNSLYNGKPIVCPTCKHNLKIQNFEGDNGIKCHDGYVICNSCSATYRYNGDFLKPFLCYCRLKHRKQDGILYNYLDHLSEVGSMNKEVPYIGQHRCDIVIYRPDGDIIYIEVDGLDHFTRRGVAKDNEFIDRFLENREDHEFLLRVDARAIVDELSLLAERIFDWIPDKPVTLAFSGDVNPFVKLELYENEYDFLP